MKDGPDIAPIASLIGDPARANMLLALMSGKALTASELAAEAGVTPQTTSSHLARLEAGGLVRQRRQGRHRYYALEGEEVAAVLESLLGLAAGRGHLRTRTGPGDPALRRARVCYDHLAGDRGTQLFETFVARGYLVARGDRLSLGEDGVRFMRAFGIDLDALLRKRSPLCRECLDWSERRSHLAGNLGRAIWRRIEERGWARREPASRVVCFSAEGEREFKRMLSA